MASSALFSVALLLFFSVTFSFAQTQVIPLLSSTYPAPQLCGLEYYDVTNLTQTPYWTFSKPNNCFPDNMTLPCDFSLAFCQPLNYTDQPFGSECDKKGACEVVNKSASYNIGSSTNNNPFQAIEGGIGFFHGYPNGGTLDCGQTHTLVYFVCDKTVPWIPDLSGSTPIPGTISVKIIAEGTGTCVLNITVFYAGACAVKPLPIDNSGLSTGSIILIVFCTMVGLYFIVGIIVNKVQGHQGVEIVPHHDFWCSLPGYISDGMSYAWGVITCSNKSVESKSYESI
ncbi:uncharacterized protein LOC144443693 [Glandiceps talaboti]